MSEPHSTLLDKTPARQTGAASLFSVVYFTQLRQLLSARKTIALTIVTLLPVLAALIFVVFQDVDGLSMFNGIVETVLFPFIIPLLAVYYGGPVVVDEMEGRTLTYLTLRPIGRPTIYLGKLAAGITVTLALTLLPLLALFLVCLVQSDMFSEMFETFLKLALGSALGVIAYTTIFTALGAAFASSLLAGIVYFVSVEMVLAALPVLELLSVRYHIRTAAGLNASKRLGFIDKLILDEPIVFDWWVGVIIIAALSLFFAAVGAYIFREKQYNV